MNVFASGGPLWKSGMFKTFVIPLGFAALTAATLALVSDRRGFEELALRAAIAEEARATNTKCPLSPEYTDTADIRLLSICLRYGLGAYQAARQYPETSVKVFAVYGEDETFQKILDRLGHEVIPVVAYFVEHGSREYKLRQAVGEAMQQMWEGRKPKWQPANITREQIGLIAIYHLERRGHEMLAEFEIVDGAAVRKPMRRFFFGLKDLLLGGVEDIETIYSTRSRGCIGHCHAHDRCRSSSVRTDICYGRQILISSRVWHASVRRHENRQRRENLPAPAPVAIRRDPPM